MVLTVVLITGGFVIDVGPLYFSAHRLVPPLVLAAVGYAVAVRQGRQSLPAADAALSVFIDRHATAIVLVLAAAAAGAGVAFGTYVASGADSSAYISQSRLLAQGDLAVRVPLASDASWPEPEWTFAPLGYRPGPGAATIVPTYPPGLPLVMALTSVVAGESGPFLVGPLFAALVVLGTYWLAVRVHSRTAGVVAAALMATSPVLLSQVVQQMSDIPSTALLAAGSPRGAVGTTTHRRGGLGPRDTRCVRACYPSPPPRASCSPSGPNDHRRRDTRLRPGSSGSVPR